MKYIHGTTEFHIEEECVLSLGKFDGLHRGHETLLEHMMEQKNKGCATVLFTFAIPPRPGRINEVQKVLTTNEEKVAICEEQGIDYLIEYPFTKEVMTMEPEAFIEMLASSMKIRGIVVGTDFHFGHNCHHLTTIKPYSSIPCYKKPSLYFLLLILYYYK